MGKWARKTMAPKVRLGKDMTLGAATQSTRERERATEN